MPSASIKIGYARVSTQDQNLDLQLRALKKEGCRKMFQEKVCPQQPVPDPI
jgi:DNA invertase Pin-like site-specific DNA recombinase